MSQYYSYLNVLQSVALQEDSYLEDVRNHERLTPPDQSRPMDLSACRYQTSDVEREYYPAVAIAVAAAVDAN